MLSQGGTGQYIQELESMYKLTHNDNLITSIVPIGDGITLSVKK